MDKVWQGIHFTAYHEQVEVGPGIVRTFEFVWRIDGTRTLAINQEAKILLQREYRHELQGFDWRLPGGKLDHENEDITNAAARELLEETGIVAGRWQYLWSTTPDATVRFRRHFLLASDLKEGSQRLGEGEQIEKHWFSAHDAIEMALQGAVKEEISALSIIRHFRAAAPR